MNDQRFEIYIVPTNSGIVLCQAFPSEFTRLIQPNRTHRLMFVKPSRFIERLKLDGALLEEHRTSPTQNHANLNASLTTGLFSFNKLGYLDREERLRDTFSQNKTSGVTAINIYGRKNEGSAALAIEHASVNNILTLEAMGAKYMPILLKTSSEKDYEKILEIAGYFGKHDIFNTCPYTPHLR